MASLGGYGDANGSASVSGGASTPGRDFLDIGQTITSAGDVESFDINMDGAQGVGDEIKLKIWRLNGANYDFVGESQTFSGLSDGSNAGLTLTTSIGNVQVGDIIGIWVSDSNSHKIDVNSNPGSDVVYKTGDDTTSQATSSYSSLPDFSLCVEVHGTAAATNSIAIPEPPANNFVYQRNSSNQATPSFTVTYTGSPTSLQYRLLDATDDTTEVVTWTTFDASPSGGTSVLNLTITASTTPMHVEVRFGNDTGITDLQVNDWWSGIRVLIFGQSLAEDLVTDDIITADSAYIYYNGTTFANPTVGRGQNQLAQLLIDMYGCAVCIANTASGGTSLTNESAGNANYWANVTSTLFTTTVTRVDGMTNSEGTLEFALWIQGSQDAYNNVTYDEYLRLNETGGLTSLVKNSRDNWAEQSGSALPIVVGVLGRRTADDDPSFQAVRNAHIHMCNADDRLYHLALFHHATDDGLHPSDAGDEEIGKCAAVLNALHRGDISVSPPKVIAVDRNAGATEFTLEFDQDLDTSVTTYSTEGIRVEADATTKSVSAFARTDTRKAKITCAAVTDTSSVVIYLGYGKGSSSSALTYPASASITLPNSAGTYKLPAENAKLELLERA